MDCDWSVLTKLIRPYFLHLPDELNEPVARVRHALLRPIGELEVSENSRLTVLDSESDVVGCKKEKHKRK